MSFVAAVTVLRRGEVAVDAGGPIAPLLCVRGEVEDCVPRGDVIEEAGDAEVVLVDGLSTVDRRFGSERGEGEGAEEERGRRLLMVFCKVSVPEGVEVELEVAGEEREGPDVLRRVAAEGIEDEVEEGVGAEVVEREREFGFVVVEVVVLRAGEDLLPTEEAPTGAVGFGAEELRGGEVVVVVVGLGVVDGMIAEDLYGGADWPGVGEGDGDMIADLARGEGAEEGVE